MEELAGKRLVLFSYGSGLASTMFSIRVTDDTSPASPLHQIMENLSDIPAKLEQRAKRAPAEFDKTMKLREDTHNSGICS